MLSAVRREIQTLPRLYWLLWWGTLLNKAGGFVVPYLTFYVIARGGSESDAGFVLSLYGTGAMISGFMGGMLADRLGRRATMLLSMFGGSVALLGMGLSPSLAWLAPATFFMGLTAELLRPAVSAAIADVVPAEHRTRAYAHLYWVINLGFALAPTLAGIVASFDYFALFAVDAASLFGYGLIVLRYVPETLERRVTPKGESHGGLRRVLGDGTFLGFSFLSLGTALVLFQNLTPLPLTMKQNGLTEATYGYIMGMNGLMIVFLQPVMSPRLARLSRTHVLAFGSLLFGLGFGLYGVAHDVPGFILATAIWTLAEIAILPLGSAVVADLSPAHLRGSYQGVYSVSWGIASSLGPLIGGGMLQAGAARQLWFGCGGLMVLVSLGHLWLGERRTARERLALAGPAIAVD